MNPSDDAATTVARLTGALARQADELRTLRAQLGTASEESQLLRADDVAARLRTSRAWVYRNQRVIGGFRVGGQLRFEPSAVDKYVEQCQGPRRKATPGARLLPVRGNPRSGPASG